MFYNTYSPPIIGLLFLLCNIAAIARGQSTPARILIYSATAGFRHDSIPTAIAALQAKGLSINIQFDATEDKARFTGEILAQYDALLFLSTTGEILDEVGKAAFQTYLNSGGNFIGIHSSSDSLVNTTFYEHEVGAYFDYHPELQDAIVDVLDPSHPSTSMLPSQWRVRDEIYNFKSDPRTLGAQVILIANESSYTDNGTRKFNQGTPHPLVWYQTHGSGTDDSHKASAGRSFYTSLGHLNETWQDDLFLSHVLGGVTWTLQGNTTRATNSSALVGNTQERSSMSSKPPSSTGIVPAATTSKSSSTVQFATTIVAVTIVALFVGYAQFSVPR